jgi:hypothetical protein
MIIVKLKGGLGNQLFQYATGRAIAERTGMTLKLDVSSYQSDALRNYRLRAYPVVDKFATAEEIECLNPSKAHYARWTASRIRNALKPYYGRSYLKERGFPFDPAILQVRQPVYLNGYWQSEKYFADIADVLVREFTPASPLSPENEALVVRMAASSSVSLHIRRGDYVASPEALRVHGVVPLDYYRQAMSLMAGRVPAPHFFIFSDDMAWVQENLSADHPMTFVGSERSNQDYDDLRLMSCCRHHITANSSFSWWGAWLNRRPDKIVVAPQKWFAAPIDTRDLIPAGWIRV